MAEIPDDWLWQITTNNGWWLLALLAVVWWYRRRHLGPTLKILSLDHFFQRLACPAWLADEHFQLRQSNQAMALLQWPSGLRPQLFSSRYCQQSVWPEIQAGLQQQQSWQGVVWQATATLPRAWQLSITPLSCRQMACYLVIQQDVSQQQQQQTELAQRTTHDALTGVSNRTLWLAQLAPVLLQCQSTQQYFAIVLLELTELDHLHQQFGNSVALQFEQWVAQQLQYHLPLGASLGQFSDRRFAVLLTPQHCQQQPEAASLQIARQLQLAVHGPCPLDNFDLTGQCAVGIVLFPQGGDDIETLLQHGERALAQSAHQQHAIYLWQQTGLPDMADATLAEELQYGLKQYQFELYFQGCYRLQDKELLAIDVQLAWHSPRRGLMWLPQFAAVAEQSHLLLALERWQLTQLCQQIWQWRQQQRQLPQFRLELSTLQLQQPDLIAFLLHHLQEWQLQPQTLQLLIKEQYWLQQPGTALTQLQALRHAGFQLIWQDFGSGHTALALLNQKCWSGVMLAKTLINDLEAQDQQRNICASLIRLAHYHQLELTAQGVDNEMQGYLLHVMGCVSGQGLLFDSPKTAEQLTADLKDLPPTISQASLSTG